MRVVVQRVRRAQVTVEETITGSIDQGLVLLVAFREGDSEEDLRWMASKCLELRIFPDEQGKMNRSLVETGGGVLVVSQFTLYGDARKGRRPSFIESAPPELAERLYDRFVRILEESGVPTGTGMFRAHMDVELVNDGPVTLILDRGTGRGDADG